MGRIFVPEAGAQNCGAVPQSRLHKLARKTIARTKLESLSNRPLA